MKGWNSALIGEVASRSDVSTRMLRHVKSLTASWFGGTCIDLRMKTWPLR
jgi:hypothetical protein